tara:strand:- start:1107 stop:1580 length:474 start_codon:yes stop_codon:yes gene_type:complete
MMNTEQIMSMMLLVLVAMMATKKTKFGQMTLRATQALEYLKTTPEPIRKSVNSIHWMHKLVAESENWEMPEWVMKNDNYDWVAILFVSDGLPLLVYQKSALRAFESHLMKLESEGAVVKSEKRGQKLSVDLGDSTVEVGMWRNPNGGKFAPFNVDFE